MSAYLWAVQVGMPEGMVPSDQQLWLHKWTLEQQATIEKLTAAKEELRKKAVACKNEYNNDDKLISELQAELAAAKERIANIAAYCDSNVDDCDPYCCAEYLREVKKLATEPTQGEGE